MFNFQLFYSYKKIKNTFSKVDHDRSQAIEGKVDDTNMDSDESDDNLEVDSKVDLKKIQATK